jgi:hypothetical protein
MLSNKISDGGVFPTITYHTEQNKVYICFQREDHIFTAIIDPLTLAYSLDSGRWVVGAESGYPEIYFSSSKILYTAWRDGAPPYASHLLSLGMIRSLDTVHGARPIAFGADYIAFISGSSAQGYPVKAWKLDTNTAPSVVRNGAGTGLSRVDENNGLPVVTLIDEDLRAVPGISDPAWAGECVVGATDRDGQPTLIARLANGDECEIAKGQDSPNPRICTDGKGTWFITAWSGKGQGIRIWRVTKVDFKKPDTRYPRTIQELPEFTEPKYVGFYYGKDSKYGSFEVQENTAILGRGLFANEDNGKLTYPPDTNQRIKTYAENVDRIFISATKEDIQLVKPYWDRVAAIVHHEVGNAIQTLKATQDAKDLVTSMGLMPRPVMSTLGPTNAVDPSYTGTADYAGCEIYFDAPAALFVEMERQTEERVNQVLSAIRGKIVLIPQMYDRSMKSWQDNPAMLEPIIFACAKAMASHSRIVGILGFALGRPGGAHQYQNEQQWLEAIVKSVSVPATLPIKKEDTPMIDRVTFYARFREINDFYASQEGLQRPGGMVIGGNADTEAMAAWGYNLMNGATVESVKAEIRRSGEWEAKHPGEKPAHGVLSGPLSAAGRDIESPTE